ncbi:MAG: rRNA maturation RNase YbeY [Kiritimatiellae bacterium]|nr:rRNA maturation RNase YbeY [Kiritimatiellia bacterium]
MRILVRNRQKTVAIDLPALKRFARELAEMAHRRENDAPAWEEVVIHLLDDPAMAAVNRAVMGHEGPTDVITQRYDPLPGEPEGLQGELFIDLAWAARKRPARRDWSLDQEILLYLAHGCDHLTGSEDTTPQERRAMRRRELRWLKSLAWTPFSTLLSTPAPSTEKRPAKRS